MKFLTHPATIITAIVAFFVGAFFIGKSTWFNNLFAPATGSTGSGTNGNGSTGNAGNGGTGDLPIDQNSVNRFSSQALTKCSPNAPATIKVWVGSPVPYSYMGWTYGKPYYMYYQGRRVMILTKLSCP